MENLLISYLKNNIHIAATDSVLLAVSGGIDSMVMLNLFLQAKIPIGIAHCNFQLRGQDSFGDEQLVSETAKRHGIAFHVIRFNTKDYAQKKGLSIQMAARELRYNWFEQIRKEHHYIFIATAHHGDDVVETFFLNLLRKTGIAGLHGIKPQLGYIIRPMLFADKASITDYAKKNNIAYRDDVTNVDDHYMRNYIRLHIIPAFQQLKPNFNDTLLESIQIIAKQETVFNNHISQIKESILKEDFLGNNAIDLQMLKNISHADVYLYEILRPFGFNETQVFDLISCLETTEEKEFVSISHRLVKTRTSINIFPNVEAKQNTVIIQSSAQESFSQVGITMNIYENSDSFIFENNPKIAYFDSDKLSFPMQVRNWQAGDSFYPFGGKGKKKLSDLFSDLKLSGKEKQSMKLLCNANGDIVWAMGLRSDNRYKVTKETKNIVCCQLY